MPKRTSRREVEAIFESVGFSKEEIDRYPFLRPGVKPFVTKDLILCAQNLLLNTRYSDKKIALMTGVSESFVKKIREALRKAG